MRPEQGRRRLAPLLHPRLVPLGPQQVALGLLGQVAVRLGACLDPREARAGVVTAAVVEVGETEHRRQQQPLPAAVVLVVEVAVHAAVHEQRRLDARDELFCADEEQRSIEPVVGPREGLALDLVRAEPVADAPERGGVYALALLPPVDARLAPVVLEPACDVRRRIFPARRVAAPAQRAEEEAEPVDLQLRPVRAVGLAVKLVAGVPRPGRPPEDHARAPVEEAVGALHLADFAHRVRYERAVAEPRVAIRLEVRAGNVAAGRRLPREYDVDRTFREAHFTEPASRPCTKWRWNEKKTTSGIS